MDLDSTISLILRDIHLLEDENVKKLINSIKPAFEFQNLSINHFKHINELYYYHLRYYETELDEPNYIKWLGEYRVTCVTEINSFLVHLLNYIHQGNVQIAPSKISKAGLGLFSDKNFNKDDAITGYDGYLCLNPHYFDEKIALYAISCVLNNQNIIMDGATHFQLKNGMGRFANGYPSYNNNSKLFQMNEEINIKIFAEKNIDKGQEIYVEYGTNYAWNTIYRRKVSVKTQYTTTDLRYALNELKDEKTPEKAHKILQNIFTNVENIEYFTSEEQCHIFLFLLQDFCSLKKNLCRNILKKYCSPSLKLTHLYWTKFAKHKYITITDDFSFVAKIDIDEGTDIGEVGGTFSTIQLEPSFLKITDECYFDPTKSSSPWYICNYITESLLVEKNYTINYRCFLKTIKIIKKNERFI
jgi:hypothetical protein